MQIPTEITTLGSRPPDPRYPTNLAILSLSVIVALIAGAFELLRGAGLLASVQGAFALSMAFFLTWALTRELDPEFDYSAFVAAGLTLLGLLFLEGRPDLLSAVWLIVVLRMVVRTPGLPVTLIDSLGVLGLAGLLLLQGVWIAGLATALAFALDGWLAPPHRRNLVFAGLSLAAWLAVLVLGGGSGAPAPFDTGALVVAGVITLFFLPLLLSGRAPRVAGDLTGEPLWPARLKAAQALTLAVILAAVVWQGRAGLVLYLPASAALLGAALYRGGRMVLKG